MAHKCSIGLRSGDWAGAFNCLGIFHINHCLFNSAGCVYYRCPVGTYKHLAFPSWWHFSFSMSLYTYLSIMPPIKCILPTPLADLHPQNIIELTFIAELIFIHTLVIPPGPNWLIFVSFTHDFLSISRCSFANRTRSSLFFLLMDHENHIYETHGELFDYTEFSL